MLIKVACILALISRLAYGQGWSVSPGNDRNIIQQQGNNEILQAGFLNSTTVYALTKLIPTDSYRETSLYIDYYGINASSNSLSFSGRNWICNVTSKSFIANSKSRMVSSVAF